MSHHHRRLFAAFATFALLASSHAYGQVPPPPVPIQPAPNLIQQIGIDQKLGAQVPLDLTFKDESGQTVPLRTYFNTKPVVLTLVYYRCPSLCTMVLNDLLRSIRTMNLKLGQDFDIVTVSFDPTETPELAAKKKQQYIREYHRSGSEGGWHFLTGNAESIARLTQAVGFRYAWDQNSKSYAHASGILVLTPQGIISRYFYGIDYAPSDLKLSLIDASSKKIGSTADRILLYCFHYDPRTGRYGVLVWRTVQIGCALTILALGSFIAHSLWRERRPAVVPLEIKR